jgi:hypothetical protein
MKLWNKAINGFPPETRNGACTNKEIGLIGRWQLLASVRD